MSSISKSQVTQLGAPFPLIKLIFLINDYSALTSFFRMAVRSQSRRRSNNERETSANLAHSSKSRPSSCNTKKAANCDPLNLASADEKGIDFCIHQPTKKVTDRLISLDHSFFFFITL